MHRARTTTSRAITDTENAVLRPASEAQHTFHPISIEDEEREAIELESKRSIHIEQFLSKSCRTDRSI